MRVGLGSAALSDEADPQKHWQLITLRLAKTIAERGEALIEAILRDQAICLAGAHKLRLDLSHGQNTMVEVFADLAARRMQLVIAATVLDIARSSRASLARIERA